MMPLAPSRPALVLIVAPADADTSTLVVALTSSLRRRGIRTGTAEARSGIDGATATVLTTGSGARFTLPGAPDFDVLRVRAAAFDPGLDLLMVVGISAGAGIPSIEVVPVGGRPAIPAAELLGTVTTQQLERASEQGGPTDDLGLASVIEARVVRAAPGAADLTAAVELPIESSRRLLDRVGAPPQRPRETGWRRWLGR